MVLSEAKLSGVLRRVTGAEDVIVLPDEGKLVGIVVSKAFQDKEEHERQHEVWTLLLEALSDLEQSDVAFVFTNTPEEKALAELEAAAGT
jgi:glucose-6-phosphate isomerase